MAKGMILAAGEGGSSVSAFGDVTAVDGSGIRQASPTCRSLSRAKFMTKSQAMGSWARNAVFTTTHLTLPTVMGTHQGE